MGIGTVQPPKTTSVAKDPMSRMEPGVGVRNRAAAVATADIAGIPRSEPSRRKNAFKPGTRALKRALLTAAPLAVADVLALLIAAAGTIGLAWLLGINVAGQHLPLLLSLECSLLAAFIFLGLYPGVGLNPVVELRQMVCGTTLTFGVFWAATRAQHVFGARAELLLWMTWPLAIAAIPLARAAARRVSARFPWWGQRVLVFGGGPAGLTVYQHLRLCPWLGLRPVGIVDDSGASETARDHNCYRGAPDGAAAIAEREGVAWAVVAMPERSRDDILRVIDRHAADFPCLLVVPDIEGLPTLWTSAHECGGLPALRVQERLLLPLPRITKRCMDLLLIVLASPLWLPLLALVALLIKLDSAGPVFYSQQRIGMGGRRFRAWKFRSMAINADQLLQDYLASDPALRSEWELTQKLRRDPRVTRVGRLLRKTSLDELPQLWNVLCREMSLIGPRPIVESEIPKYSHYFNLYIKVSPGISGLWQVSGRNNTTYQQRVELDAFYCRNWSLWLDLFILVRTVKVVLLREGAY